MNWDSFFEGLFTHTPSWFFVASSIVILIGLTAATIWIVLGAKRFAESLGKENKIIELKDEVYRLRTEKGYYEDISSKLLTVIENSRLFMNTLNDAKGQHLDYSYLIQRIIESLASDIKTKTGEKHRCGYWAPNDETQTLLLLHGSSGFPDHYIGKRQLGFDQSIAGRSYRKRALINCEDVEKDADYHSSNSNYKSLICVPINGFGVLTIDGHSPFDKNAESIAELYGSIIESVLLEFYIREVFSKEVAAYAENNNEEGSKDDQR